MMKNNFQYIETSMWKVYFLNKYTNWKRREELVDEFKNLTFPLQFLDFLKNETKNNSTSS